MISMRQILFRGRALARKEAFDRELDEEVRFHLEMETAANVERGMSPAEARRAALRDFGGVDKAKEECREERGLPGLERLARDIRYGLRLLRRSPAFTVAAVLSLALAIGVNTAIFSFVNAVLLRPLPVDGLDRLVAVYDELPGLNLVKAAMSPGEVADLSRRTDLFEVSAAFRKVDMTLGGDIPEPVQVTATMGRYFDVLGGRPQLGRLYTPEESEPARSKVAVLSHGFWRSSAGGDPDVVGRTLELDGARYQVVGVLAPDFRFPRETQVWVPFSVSSEALLQPQGRTRLIMSFVGRLKPGVSHGQLAEQLTAEASRWHERIPYDPAYQHTLSAEPFVNSIAGPLRPILLALMGAVLLVLLIACANLASLQMVRATGRWREMAARTALGAGRGSLLRQLLTESLVLAAAGGVAGLLLGIGTVRLLSRWNAVQHEVLRDVRLDPSVLAFAISITLLAGLLFGLLPALRATRIQPQDVLKESVHQASGGAPQRWMLQAGVVVQFALALTLVLASGLTFASLSRLLAVDPGFRADHTMTLRVGLTASRYTQWQALDSFYKELLARVEAVREVEAAGLVAGLPFGGGGDSSPFQIVDRPKEADEPERHANIRMVAGDYFQAMRIPLLRGRLFDETDGMPDLQAFEQRGEMQYTSVVIDEALAKKYFGKEDPLGKVLQQTGFPAVIVGVVGSVRDEGLEREGYPTAYYSQFQQQSFYPMSLVVRSRLAPDTVVALARTAVGELDPAATVSDVAPLRSLIDRSLGSRRL
ncbi:MAG TPA: ABC transporter permease, partial [Thermoanaerobaculia bacterium]|nr:ABC transporter permease [Thermoanaerobaculia bacterium]